ncbi:PLAC8 family-domain-containing protein [Aspergillus similis]
MEPELTLPPASGHNWSYSFWEFWTPIDTCLMAWCCPCILFGKTQARLNDSTLASYSPINEFCLIWCGLNCCAASFLIQTKKRSGLRQKYGITETHLERDCLVSFCCPCCGLVQTEKEVVRLQREDVQPVPGYQKTQGMQYP